MPPPDAPRLASRDELPAPVRNRGVRNFLLLALGILAAFDAVIESLNANWAVALPTAVVALLTPLVLHLGRRERFARLPELYGLTILGVFLILGGATQWHHAPNLVWFPLYPFAYYFLGGLRAGTALSALGLSWLTGSYLAYPQLQNTPPVESAHAVQVLFAFGMSAVIGYFYERTRARQQQLLHEQAAADYLTGLPNRRGFFQVADTIAEQAKRLSHSFSIILFDLDNFKTVNDRYGHDTGDTLLRETTRLVQEGIRRGDVLARWGGEEFIILLPQCNLESAAALAEKLRTRFASQVFAAVGPVTASFGVAEAAPLEDINNLISRADRALYRAKHAGKNRVETEPV